MEFERSAITRFMRDLPVRKVPGFGRVTERCLEGLGVEVSAMTACGLWKELTYRHAGTSTPSESSSLSWITGLAFAVFGMFCLILH